jgi:hypothetical protein
LTRRSDVRGVALGRVIHPQIVADPPDDDGAGVDPDAHPQPDGVTPLELVSVLREAPLDAERRVRRPPRSVLVSDRRAEERHDAVTPILVDRAVEAVDFGGDPLEAAFHDPVDVFGVEFLRDRSESRAIGEQHGHHAPLSL